MPRVANDAERQYVERRLAPVLERLRDDRKLRAEFLEFAAARGGDLSLMVPRLQTAWWKSRRGQFVHFFVLVLTEFGYERNLLVGAAASRTPAKTARR